MHMQGLLPLICIRKIHIALKALARSSPLSAPCGSIMLILILYTSNPSSYSPLLLGHKILVYLQFPWHHGPGTTDLHKGFMVIILDSTAAVTHLSGPCWLRGDCPSLEIFSCTIESKQAKFAKGKMATHLSTRDTLLSENPSHRLVVILHSPFPN